MKLDTREKIWIRRILLALTLQLSTWLLEAFLRWLLIPDNSEIPPASLRFWRRNEQEADS